MPKIWIAADIRLRKMIEVVDLKNAWKTGSLDRHVEKLHSGQHFSIVAAMAPAAASTAPSAS